MTRKKNQSTETDSVMTEIKKLADKDIKTAIKNVLHLLQNIEKNMNMLRRKMRSFQVGEHVEVLRRVAHLERRGSSMPIPILALCISFSWLFLNYILS